MSASFLEIADRFPPNICRLLATKSHGKKGMTIRDIAAASGVPKSTVSDIVNPARASWKGVPIEIVDAISRACGVDLMAPHRERYKARQMAAGKVAMHIRKSRGAQRRSYLNIVRQPPVAAP